MKLEDVELAAFQLISLSGQAIDCYYKALDSFKAGKVAEQKKYVEEGEIQMNKAHKIQMDFIAEEAKGNCPPYSLVMVHAQDYMMSTIMIKRIIEEMMELYAYVNSKII